MPRQDGDRMPAQPVIGVHLHSEERHERDQQGEMLQGHHVGTLKVKKKGFRAELRTARPVPGATRTGTPRGTASCPPRRCAPRGQAPRCRAWPG